MALEPRHGDEEAERRLTEALALLREGGAPLAGALPAMLEDPVVRVRWLAIRHLIREAARGVDLSPLLPALQTARTDGARLDDNPWLPSVGDQALMAIVMHHASRHEWEDIRLLLAVGGAQVEPVLSALSSEGLDLSPLWGDVEALRRAPEPDVRGRAAGVLMRHHHRAGRWKEIEALIQDADYAVRWYTVSALENLAEAGVDLEPVLPALVRIFERPDEELEAAHDVRYKGTLRQLVAWLLLWRLRGKRGFRRAASYVVAGVDLKQVPEILAELNDRRGQRER